MPQARPMNLVGLKSVRLAISVYMFRCFNKGVKI